MQKGDTMLESVQELNVDEIDDVSGGTSSLWYDAGYYLGRAAKYFSDLPGGVDVWQGG